MSKPAGPIIDASQGPQARTVRPRGLIPWLAALFVAIPTARAAAPVYDPAPVDWAAYEKMWLKDFTRALPSEAIRGTYSEDKAREFLDDASLKWVHQNRCGTCHTTVSYLMARPLIGSAGDSAAWDTGSIHGIELRRRAGAGSVARGCILCRLHGGGTGGGRLGHAARAAARYPHLARLPLGLPGVRRRLGYSPAGRIAVSRARTALFGAAGGAGRRIRAGSLLPRSRCARRIRPAADFHPQQSPEQRPRQSGFALGLGAYPRIVEPGRAGKPTPARCSTCKRRTAAGPCRHSVPGPGTTGLRTIREAIATGTRRRWPRWRFVS